MLNATGSDVVFTFPNGTDALRIKPTGEFFVMGRPTTVDMEVYESFKQWLETMRHVFENSVTVELEV